MNDREPRIRNAFEANVDQAKQLIRDGKPERAWPALERAHVLGQASAWRHVRSHAWMLLCGLRQWDAREVLGQLVRLVLAAPASALGRYPVGNSGRATVDMLEPMPVEVEIGRILFG